MSGIILHISPILWYLVVWDIQRLLLQYWLEVLRVPNHSTFQSQRSVLKERLVQIECVLLPFATRCRIEGLVFLPFCFSEREFEFFFFPFFLLCFTGLSSFVGWILLQTGGKREDKMRKTRARREFVNL